MKQKVTSNDKELKEELFSGFVKMYRELGVIDKRQRVLLEGGTLSAEDEVLLYGKEYYPRFASVYISTLIQAYIKHGGNDGETLLALDDLLFKAVKVMFRYRKTRKMLKRKDFNTPKGFNSEGSYALSLKFLRKHRDLVPNLKYSQVNPKAGRKGWRI